jgi:hypothetical protein
MLDIFRNNLFLLTVILAFFTLLQNVVSEEHKNRLKSRLDPFISLDYSKVPTTLATYALYVIDHAFGLTGDYLPRALQIVHVNICITFIALISIRFSVLHYDPLATLWVVLDLFIMVLLMFSGWKRLKTLAHTKYFWYAYLSLISMFLVGDYYLDIIFYPGRGVSSWLGSIRNAFVFYVINLLFDVLTVVVTVKILQRLIESGCLMQLSLIIGNMLVAYILMLIEYYFIFSAVLPFLFPPFTFDFTDFSLIDALRSPISSIVSPAAAQLLISVTLCSSTTLIPITLYLCVLFLAVSSKPILEGIRYMLKSLSEKEDYPIFIAVGAFCVVLIGIALVIIQQKK